jgi:hypothetical protein
MANQLTKYLISTFGLFMSGYSASACAQTVMFDNIMPSFIDTNLRNQVLWEPYRNTKDTKSIETRAQNLVKLSYKSVPAQRKANLSKFVSKVRAVDPSGADQLAQMFASTDIIGAVGKGIAPYGLRTDNLADAYAVYWTNAWLGSRGRSDDFEKTQILAVRSQAASALTATPALASATNEQKQEMAEALFVQAALIGSAVEGAQSDPALMAQVKSAIAQGAKAMGLDLYTMTLTDNGFVPAKKGSAVDDEVPAPPGQEKEKQALASTMPPAEATNYVLIAAAGGAGLGGMFLLGKAMGRKS